MSEPDLIDKVAKAMDSEAWNDVMTDAEKRRYYPNRAWLRRLAERAIKAINEN